MPGSHLSLLFGRQEAGGRRATNRLSRERWVPPLGSTGAQAQRAPSATAAAAARRRHLPPPDPCRLLPPPTSPQAAVPGVQPQQGHTQRAQRRRVLSRLGRWGAALPAGRRRRRLHSRVRHPAALADGGAAGAGGGARGGRRGGGAGQQRALPARQRAGGRGARHGGAQRACCTLLHHQAIATGAQVQRVCSVLVPS